VSRLVLSVGIALLLVETTLAVVLISTSDHDSNKGISLGLAVTVGVAFVISGLVALWRRPENRTGVYLAAIGYLWFFGALEESNNAWVYTSGFALGGLAWIPLAALLLAYPAGRFESRLERVFPWIVGAALFGLSAALLAFDPTPDSTCTRCPNNPIALTDSSHVAKALDVLDASTGILLALFAVGLLVRRWRRANPALRRALWPVLATGGAALTTIVVVSLVEQLVSESLAQSLWPIFLVFLAAVPLAFLFGVLRTRLARSAVSEVVVELQRGAPTRETLAHALRDPTLELVYRLPGGDRWVDGEGDPVPAPQPSSGRSVTLIERLGVPIAALEHDAVLDEEHELVDAVTAAAGLAIHNERLRAEARAQYVFLETITDTAPSLLVNVGIDGRIVNQNQAAVDVAGADDQEELRGLFFWDVFIDESERADVIARFEALAPEFPSSEYENTFSNARGEMRVVYWRTSPVRDKDGTVRSIIAGGLDITERKRHEEEIRASRARIVRAEDEARRKLERNLHDGAQQRLVSLSVALRLIESKLTQDPVAATELLAGAREELSHALEELRELARGIHPAVLSDRGLGPALETLVARAPLPVELEVGVDGLPADVEAAAYYVVAEALTNVAKYGHASSATVRVAAENGTLEVSVRDDGVGGADPEKGSGLRGLADRVEALAGRLEVTSSEGTGTTVSASIPLSSAEKPS